MAPTLPIPVLQCLPLAQTLAPARSNSLPTTLELLPAADAAAEVLLRSSGASKRTKRRRPSASAAACPTSPTSPGGGALPPTGGAQHVDGDIDLPPTQVQAEDPLVSEEGPPPALHDLAALDRRYREVLDALDWRLLLMPC